jgi:hypothetical protein
MCVETTATRPCCRLSPRCQAIGTAFCILLAVFAMLDAGLRALLVKLLLKLVREGLRISRGRGAQRPAAPALPLTARYLFHHKSNLNAVVRPNDLQCVRWISNLANILRPLLASPPLPPTLAKLRHIPRRISSSTRIHKLGSRNQTTRSPMAVFLMAAKAPRSLTVCRVAP